MANGKLNTTGQEQKEILELGDEGFWARWWAKLLFTLISVKFWGLLAGTWISTYLVWHGKIENVHWVTFNTTIWALIYGMKEVFRISEGRDKAEQKLVTLQSEAEEKVTAMKLLATEASGPRITPEGKEIVGNDPDE